MTFTPGMYKVISRVRIRREPKIVERLDLNGKQVSNAVGTLEVGTQKQVLDIVTDKNNYTWGRLSEPDAAGVSQWACIRGLNRTYMVKVTVSSPDDRTITLDERVAKLEEWAKTQGFEG